MTPYPTHTHRVTKRHSTRSKEKILWYHIQEAQRMLKSTTCEP